MRTFIAFLKKELLENLRNGKLAILGVLFLAFGVMNPAIAKLTPLLYEIMSEELAESGMTVTKVDVNAITSWIQFFKNIPMALIVFTLIFGNTFTKEYQSETLVLMLTKGLARYKVVLAKSLVLITAWTLGYWLCFGITYGANDFFWDNGIAENLLPAAANWWLFGALTLTFSVFFSVISSSYAGVLIGTGGCVLIPYLVGLFPRLSHYVPTSLMNGGAMLTGGEEPAEYLGAVIISVVLCVIFIAVSIPIFNKKQI